MKIERLPYKFTPRDYQLPLFDAFFNKKIKKGYIVWHRRAGKDKCYWNLLVGKALERIGNYFYIFPEIGQGRKAIWVGIDKHGNSFLDHIPKPLIKRINNTEMRIELFNGSTIQIVGASRYDKLVGTSVAGIICSEYALQTPFALKYLLPIINENNGWLLVNTTPRGHNHAYKLYEAVKNDPEWYVSFKTVSDTRDENGQPIISDSQIESDKKIMSIEEIRQECFCDWDVALSNAYFSKYLRIAESQNRILNFHL